MSKPRYKMRRVGDLPDGTIFWSHTSGKTWDIKARRFVQEARIEWKGKVCYQLQRHTKVWVFDAALAVPIEKSRLVFVEVLNV